VLPTQACLRRLNMCCLDSAGDVQIHNLISSTLPLPRLSQEEDVLLMERTVLRVLDCELNVPTAHTFWRLLETSCGAGDICQLALYIMVRGSRCWISCRNRHYGRLNACSTMTCIAIWNPLHARLWAAVVDGCCRSTLKGLALVYNLTRILA